jgi:hypothetical protein
MDSKITDDVILIQRAGMESKQWASSNQVGGDKRICRCREGQQ